MTVLENSIHIDAAPERVWSVLATLDALDQYDPGIKKSEIVSESKEGLGAARRCDLTPGGWFKEKVAAWQPHEAVSFELFECTLPVHKLRHSYTLKAEDGGTRVVQRMEYELKFGVIGRVMDALMVRKKWDAGVKGFFAGLKDFVEKGEGETARLT
jgi:ligand-binding SRPBCC domain-containing protein